LVGRNISYSFSKGYFSKKFEALGLVDHSYENFDLPEIGAINTLLAQNPDIAGFNVTIPYKEAILPYLTDIDAMAKKIGAVNTVKLQGDRLIGYNTDAYGFQKSLEPFLEAHHQKALILGTGGASKAIAFVLDRLRIAYKFVSRRPLKNQLGYGDLTQKTLQEYLILINCTPLGTHPNVHEKPDIPYDFITARHLLFDLIYNPEKTTFLVHGELKGASICNGHRMLELQAEKSWEIWTTEPKTK
tara:strand:+ start:434 stop:1165 length:732 start_codon:yes stop_codon:yes gene_type:complete